MSWLAASFLMLAVLGETLANTQSPPGRIGSIAPPAGFGPTALVILDLEEGRVSPDGYYCPPDLTSDEICLGSDFVHYRGRARPIAVQNTFGDLARQRMFRLVGRHGGISYPGGRFVAIVERTESGYAWAAWHARIDRRLACVPAAIITHFRIVLPAASTRAEDGARCFRV